MEFHLGINNEVMTFVWKWVELEIIMLSEIKHIQEEK